MSERVIGKKSIQQLAAETDEWNAALAAFNRRYEGATVRSLAEKWNCPREAARRVLDAWVRQGWARMIGKNRCVGEKGGGMEGVYELTDEAKKAIKANK